MVFMLMGANKRSTFSVLWKQDLMRVSESVSQAVELFAEGKMHIWTHTHQQVQLDSIHDAKMKSSVHVMWCDAIGWFQAMQNAFFCDASMTQAILLFYSLKS